MRSYPNDTDPDAERVQLGLLRKATVAARASMAFSLSEMSIRLALRAIRRQSPELSNEEVLLRFVEIHHGSDLADGLRRDLRRRSK